MDYRFLKTFEFNFDYGTLLSVDFGSCDEYDDFSESTEEIFNEIKDYVKNRGIPGLIWFKGIGDSIRYTNSKQIIDLIKEKYPNQKIGVYLNCALFEVEEVRKEFYGCDLVTISLNSVDPNNFSKINKCPESVKSQDILEGIKEFRKDFNGNLGIYSMFIRSVNDNLKTVEDLKMFILEVMPDHYSVSNYTLNGFRPVSNDFKKELKMALRYLPFKVIYMF